MGVTRQMTLEGQLYYDSTCKWCGKQFNKTHNHQVYCCPTCKKFARLEQKARYQRKRRYLIRIGELVSNETKQIGTNFLSHRRRKDFDTEHLMIRKEMKRLKLR